MEACWLVAVSDIFIIIFISISIGGLREKNLLQERKMLKNE